MAYNRKNLLRRIIYIQNLTLEHKAKGMFQERIYTTIIFPVFGISKSTYYRYLSTNAKKEFKELENNTITNQ